MRRVPIALLVLAAALAAGCGEKQESRNGDSEPLTLALDFYVNPDHAGIYTALDRGYFDEAGLEVEPQVPSDPSAPIRQVAAGRADLAISYEPEVLLARDQGLPVVAVAALVSRPLTSLISLPEAGISRPADLAGKTVATAGIPYQAAYLDAIAERAGIDPDDGHPGRRRPQPAARGALGPRRRDARRLLQHRGRRPRRARPPSARGPGRPARDPHLRRARPGRRRRPGRRGPGGDPPVHRRARARHASGGSRPGGGDRGDPRRPATGSTRSSPGPRSTAPCRCCSATSRASPFGYMNGREWEAFAGFFADNGLITTRPGAAELLTNELLPREPVRVGRRGCRSSARAPQACDRLPDPPEADQALMLAAPSGGGRGRARSALVAPTGLRQTETRAPLRSGDEDQALDDLPSALRPGPRRATPPTGPQPAHGTHEAKGPGRRPRAPRQNRRDGADRPATARGRRAQGAGSLGGRFARRQAKPFLRRHPGRAPYPLRDVGSAGLRADHRERDPSA